MSWSLFASLILVPFVFQPVSEVYSFNVAELSRALVES